MGPYILRRLGQMIPTLFGVLVLVFVLFSAFGSDPALILAGLGARADQIAAIRHQLRLDQPLYVQFLHFLGEVVRFDWGRSWATNELVSHIFLTRLPATLTVMIPIIALQTLLAIPLGLGVAYVRGSLTDRMAMAVTTVALSISFLVYVLVGQWLLGFQLGWFPVQGWSPHLGFNLVHYAPLPVLLAILVALSPQTRLYRSFFLDEIGHDYVRTARAKGLGEGEIVFKHVLRNALIPIVTDISIQLPGIFVGAFLLEQFFSIPGLGHEILLAVGRGDYPVIQAITIYLAAFTMVVNLLTDMLYRMLDPRVVLK